MGAPGQRDPQIRLGFFRGRARPTPTEVSSFIEEHRERFGVEPICATLEVSASAYYERRTGRRSPRAIGDERLLARIREIHERNYCAYGYRRMWIALQREGEEVGPRPGAAVDEGRRNPRRQAARKGLADDKARSARLSPARPGRARLQRRGPESPLGADLSYLRCWEGNLFFSSTTTPTRHPFRPEPRIHRYGSLTGNPVLRRPIESGQYTSIDYTQTLDDHGVPRLGRLGRRCLRQCHGRELRRFLQDRVDRRSHLALSDAARARRRPVHRLGQQ